MCTLLDTCVGVTEFLAGVFVENEIIEMSAEIVAEVFVDIDVGVDAQLVAGVVAEIFAKVVAGTVEIMDSKKANFSL